MQTGLWEDALQDSDKRYQRPLLRLVECVGGTATTVEPTHIADADAVLVVTIGMGTHYFDRPPDVDGAVEVDDIVIANVVEATLQVPLAYLFDGMMSVLAGGGAVDDDVVNLSHKA